jgi:hypothetical protein
VKSAFASAAPLARRPLTRTDDGFFEGAGTPAVPDLFAVASFITELLRNLKPKLNFPFAHVLSKNILKAGVGARHALFPGCRPFGAQASSDSKLLAAGSPTLIFQQRKFSAS